MKKTTENEARLWLENNAPHIILLKWANSGKQKSKFFNNREAVEFWAPFNNVKTSLLKNSQTPVGKKSNHSILSRKSAEEWLSKNAPHLKLIQWGGKASDLSEFLDTRRNKKFKKNFSYVKSFLSKNPNSLIDPDPEELKSLLRESFRKNNTMEKMKEGVKKKYGVENVSKIKEIVQKRTKTLKKTLSFKEVKDKTIKTCIQKYGVPNPAQSEEIQEKIKKTNLKKYGVERPSQNILIQEKIKKSKIKNKITTIVDDLSLKEWAKNKGCSYSFMAQVYREQGSNAVIEYSLSQTSIEKTIQELLLKNNISFEKDKSFKKGTRIRPDFFIPKENLIIECDGLYWHSDAKVKKDYHLKKKKIYDNQNINSLFFREDEILKKFDVVASIIKNKLNLSQKVFARKCSIGTTTSDFFEKNHLMGKGSGRIYALIYKGRAILSIQVKWKNKTSKVLEISRFAPALGFCVVGGFSKLISHVIKKEAPSKIITFIDLRYGNGSYLKSLGWKKITENISFKWTKNQQTVHRMKFPGNSGYDHGWAKIWDCGQARWELIASSPPSP